MRKLPFSLNAELNEALLAIRRLGCCLRDTEAVKNKHEFRYRARSELEQIYNNSDWYAARAAAGFTLVSHDGAVYKNTGADSGVKKFNRRKESWLLDLSKSISACKQEDGMKIPDRELRLRAVYDAYALEPYFNGQARRLLFTAYKDESNDLYTRQLARDFCLS